ncbi:MAG: indolepyruvate ferredoxin oxidoreductase subunit alpha, partial [Candidatus Ranarchaeia archaeon]
MVITDVINPIPIKAFMMSNEAIVRAALESDVKVISCYPGSPTSEIIDTFSRASEKFDYNVEFSINEKVALETVAGASISGFRSITAMKSVGMNVASDALHSLAYTGVKSGMVLVSADDPSCWSSQSEQDGRLFGLSSYLPVIEPATPQEAYEMTKWAFEVSEKFSSIVILRTTTRVNHQEGIVEVREIKRSEFVKKKWKDVKKEYLTVAKRARELKSSLLSKTKEIQNYFANSKFNRVIEGEG